MLRINWASQGARVAQILEESGNDYALAERRVLEEFGVVAKYTSLLRNVQKLRKQHRPVAQPASVPLPPPAPRHEERPVFERFANPPGVYHSDQTPLPPMPRSMWEVNASTIVSIPTPDEGLCVVVSDIHYPYEDKRAIDIVLQRVADTKPHTVIINGDAIDNYQLSHHDQSPARSGDNLQRELDSIRPFIYELLKHTRHLHWIMGNHEKRTWSLIQENPGLYGLRALEFSRLAELPPAVQVYPFLTKLRFADTLVCHGQITAQNVASTAWRRFQSQIIVGHSHRASTHINTHPVTLDRSFALAQGTLCDIARADFVDHPPWDLGWAEILTWRDSTGKRRCRPEQRLVEGYSIPIDGKVYRG